MHFTNSNEMSFALRLRQFSAFSFSMSSENSLAISPVYCDARYSGTLPTQKCPTTVNNAVVTVFTILQGEKKAGKLEEERALKHRIIRVDGEESFRFATPFKKVEKERARYYKVHKALLEHLVFQRPNRRNSRMGHPPPLRHCF